MGVSTTGIITRLPQYSLCESEREKVHDGRSLTVNWKGKKESSNMFMVFTKILTGGGVLRV